MSYDFRNLSHADFEDLVLDLVGRSIDKKFERFCAGPDGGVDGRHSKSGVNIILQAKHYANSKFSNLKSQTKKELASIKKLKPSRYIFVTSLGLTPKNKTTLHEILAPFLDDPGDIVGREDLNQLLRDYPEVERSHFKLWLSSSAVLQRIVHAASANFNSMSKEEIERKVSLFARNPSFDAAQRKLEDVHTTIISGAPGVGKTTLAQMIAFSYMSEGWRLVSIRSLGDGFAEIKDAEKQIFFFDDFLGRVALDRSALSHKDSELHRFIRRVANSPNARFLLTTRAYIFEEARQASEYLSDNSISITKYVLDVGVYTRSIKARILYNHLACSETPQEHINQLVDSGVLPKLIDHANYNPRIVEWMTDRLGLEKISSKQYPEAFLCALENPSRLWDTAFREHIPRSCQHLLLTVFFGSEYGIGIRDLERAYDPLHDFFCKKYREKSGPKDFEQSLKILEGGFIQIRNKKVNFVNPSLRDYLSEYLDDKELLCDIASCTKDPERANNIWQFSINIGLSRGRRKLANSFKVAAKACLKRSTFKQVRMDPSGMKVRTRSGLQNIDRITLLLDWWEVSQKNFFLEIAKKLAEAPVDGLDSWRDGEKAVDLIAKLRSGEISISKSDRLEMASSLETAFIEMTEAGMPIDELSEIWGRISEKRQYHGVALIESVRDSIAACIESTSQEIMSAESTSTLEDHLALLTELAESADITFLEADLDQAEAVIMERIEYLKEQIPKVPDPIVAKPKKSTDEKFDDNHLLALFTPLKR